MFRSIPLFEGVPDDALADLASAFEWVTYRGGETLFTQGDESDHLLIVLTGRLAVVKHGEFGDELMRELGPGDHLGEIGLVTGEPRSATVRASRDSVVGRVGKSSFEEFASRHQGPLFAFSRVLANQLREAEVRERETRAPRTIALHPLTPDAPTMFLVAGLMNFLKPEMVLHLKSSPGSELSSRIPSDGSVDSRLTSWLNEQEGSHRWVIYHSDGRSSPWTGICLRQADRILTVAWADTPPGLEVVRNALSILPGRMVARDVELLLVHRESESLPRGTAQWLNQYPFARHHHLRVDSSRDIPRLGRHLSGQSVGLVLGGGGARAYAHIGVIQALEEADIPIDHIGGSSLGAMIAAQYARGYDVPGMIRLNTTEWVHRAHWRDFTLPLVSLRSARSLIAAIQAGFGDERLEDLWFPCFSLSTDLTHGRIVIHRKGRIVDVVRAGLSIPGVFPPVTSTDGALLVDGGVMNNLPVDVMRKLNPGPVIAVDVSPRIDSAFSSDFPETPGSAALLVEKIIRHARRRRYPGILRILQRSALVPTFGFHRQLTHEIDLYLAPPVQHIDLFDWRSIDRLVDFGYRSTTRRLAEVDLSIFHR